MKSKYDYFKSFESGETYPLFVSEKLHTEDLEYIEKMNHLYQTCVVDDETLLRLKNITKEIKLMAIAERWCPDTIINLPALAIMEGCNPKIQLRILTRAGHEEMLSDVLGLDKSEMPTVLVFMDETLMGVFRERPKVVVLAEGSDDQLRKIGVMKAYREGRYMVETICDILDILEKV